MIQTLSVVVPTPKCVNNCAFCVSKMGTPDSVNQIEKNKRFMDLYDKDYIDCLFFARDNGCNTLILTGDGEPLQNQNFLERFSYLNKALGDNRFRIIELQTTGTFITDEKLRFLRNMVRVKLISLSVSDLFNSVNNCGIIGVPKPLAFDLEYVAKEIKRYDFTLRFSINMLNVMDTRTPEETFERLALLGADQVIFRQMYGVPGTPEGEWVEKYAAAKSVMTIYNQYIKTYGKPLEVLPFGAIRYSLHGISTVLDENCMPQEVNKDIRYLVLDSSCRLRTRWDDKGSLLF